MKIISKIIDHKNIKTKTNGYYKLGSIIDDDEEAAAVEVSSTAKASSCTYYPIIKSKRSTDTADTFIMHLDSDLDSESNDGDDHEYGNDGHPPAVSSGNNHDNNDDDDDDDDDEDYVCHICLDGYEIGDIVMFQNKTSKIKTNTYVDMYFIKNVLCNGY
jgi:hypothetical protein